MEQQLPKISTEETSILSDDILIDNATTTNMNLDENNTVSDINNNITESTFEDIQNSTIKASIVESAAGVDTTKAHTSPLLSLLWPISLRLPSQASLESLPSQPLSIEDGSIIEPTNNVTEASTTLTAAAELSPLSWLSSLLMQKLQPTTTVTPSIEPTILDNNAVRDVIAKEPPGSSLLPSPPLLVIRNMRLATTTSSSVVINKISNMDYDDSSLKTQCGNLKTDALDKNLTIMNFTYRSNYFNEFFAGFCASIVASLVMQPLDAIKLNQIAQKSSILDTIRSIYLYGGLRGFYRAAPISCLAYGSTYGIYFPINKYLKNENFLNIDHKYLQFFVSTLPPTLISMTIVNPLWVIKSMQASTANTNHGLIGSAKHIYKQYGIRGFYSGLMFGYLNSINGILTFTFYDILKDHFNATTALDFALCSSVAKTLAYFVSFPIFTMRIRQQLNQKGLIWNLRYVRREPFSSLYYGLFINLLQMIPKTALMLVIYEKIKCID